MRAAFARASGLEPAFGTHDRAPTVPGRGPVACGGPGSARRDRALGGCQRTTTTFKLRCTGPARKLA